MKKDKYLRARGGNAKIYCIFCPICDHDIIHYQKDGIGFLHRCYLNRIISPIKYANLQHDPTINQTGNLIDLVCECGAVIGYPMRHKDGRLAYRLERGKFKHKIIN